ncbi:hypothetical protein F511_39815 [Dorcoceras hygrometricum]|uniref:Uncharacterized protein n=1 Tax=Dorcoceras hygrometricum TaxID=472368 RepID=A0A2Z7CL78_9LAMI|nr:hypothetical protein F511_39815 [Dorcoceras hygrometricum]
MSSRCFTINVQQRRPKLNQLEHINLADDEDQLQALKSKVNQLSPFQKKKKKKRRWSWNDEVQQEATVEDSADEEKRERRSDVVLRFSRWINVDDVISDVIQSQESAGSLHPDARGSDVVWRSNQSQVTVHQQGATVQPAVGVGNSDSKTMSST